MNGSRMRVYFDYNATTPLAPEVTEAVARATQDLFGNASSVHHFGQQAKAAVDEARSAIAALINGDPSEIVFTSGGTESDNFPPRRRGGTRANRPASPGGFGHRARGGPQHPQSSRTARLEDNSSIG